MAVTTFLKFGELPTEIRIMIWTQAAFEPRIMEYALAHHGERFESSIGLLLACRESAEITSPICKDSPIVTHLSGRTAYFNYERDILYVTGIFHYNDEHFSEWLFDKLFRIHFWIGHCKSFDPSKLRHLALAMDLAVCQQREAPLRARGLCHDAVKAHMLATWVNCLPDSIHKGLGNSNLRTITLTFDATEQREKRPHYYDYSVAKNFKLLDASKSRILPVVQINVEKKLLNTHKQAPQEFLDQLPDDSPLRQPCDCWKEKANLKIRFGTVERERIKPATSNEKIHYSLDPASENWGEAAPYFCNFCDQEIHPLDESRKAWSRPCKPAEWNEKETIKRAKLQAEGRLPQAISRSIISRGSAKIAKMWRRSLKRWNIKNSN